MEYLKSKEDLFEFSYELLNKIKNSGKEPVFLCVGSDKYVADSLAPIVAEILKKEYNLKSFVYGGLDYNVNGTNLMECVSYIETIHPDNMIIVIDATLDKNIGDVYIREGCFAGMGNCLPIKKLGAISILGVVGRKVANFNLNSIRLKVIMDMARFIALGCYLAVNKLRNYDDKKKLF